MPITKFKLLHGDEWLDENLPAFNSMLPSSMKVVCDLSGYYIISVETPTEYDARAQYQVNRELDRLFFFTCVLVKATMIKSTVSAEYFFPWSIPGSIPSGTKPQNWNYAIGLQLRLWSLAYDAEDPLAKMLLLYQIIELSEPTFPSYLDPSGPPHPLTECKLIRNLIVHSGDVGGNEQRAYCEYLGIPAVMLDRTDDAYVAQLSSKCTLLEEQAKSILQSAL